MLAFCSASGVSCSFVLVLRQIDLPRDMQQLLGQMIIEERGTASFLILHFLALGLHWSVGLA